MLSYCDKFDIISGSGGTHGAGTFSGTNGTCARYCSTGTPSTFRAPRCAATSSGAGGMDVDILH